MTNHQQEELRLIESSMVLDKERKMIVAEYPIIKDPTVLSNNRKQAISIQTRIERSLERSGQTSAYNEEFGKMIAQGCMREISQDELDDWRGGINYISHHGVLKPGSTTTPLRIVSNSSLSNNNSGHSYNSILAKGPNSIMPLLRVLTTFRCYERIVCWDLHKAYNSIETTQRELHYR